MTAVRMNVLHNSSFRNENKQDDATGVIKFRAHAIDNMLVIIKKSFYANILFCVLFTVEMSRYLFISVQRCRGIKRFYLSNFNDVLYW